jgi:phage host-nuclease inhibitor protein Gam
MTEATKAAPTKELKSIEEVNASLARLIELGATISEREGKFATDSAALRTECDADLADANAEKEQLEKAIETFCRDNKGAYFAESKTLKLIHGECKFRESTTLAFKGKLKAEEVVAKIRAQFRDHKNYVRITEAPDKEALKDLTDQALASVGIVRKQQDSFSISLKETKLPEAAKAAA